MANALDPIAGIGRAKAALHAPVEKHGEHRQVVVCRLGPDARAVRVIADVGAQDFGNHPAGVLPRERLDSIFEILQRARAAFHFLLFSHESSERVIESDFDSGLAVGLLVIPNGGRKGFPAKLREGAFSIRNLLGRQSRGHQGHRRQISQLVLDLGLPALRLAFGFEILPNALPAFVRAIDAEDGCAAGVFEFDDSDRI